MEKQYWIGGFYIDLSRNLITQNSESQTLAPKALAVLTYLAQNQGKVVSQDELLDHVWKDTVVSPNTLQRSIAQLRKALGDDGKVQVYIKTHAKKGYSLECDVRWQQNQDAQNNDAAVDKLDCEQSHTGKANENPAIASGAQQNNNRLFAIVSTVLLLSIVIWYAITAANATPQLLISEIRALTATDKKENSGIYSPDGKYIVFHRYSEEQCINNIWAKNIATQEEIQLTKEFGVFGRHSISPDGKKITFISENDCVEPVNQKKCYQLVSLDFEQALQAPQLPTVLTECKNSKISRPIWLSNSHIALLLSTEGRSKLITYSITDNTSSVLYEIDGGSVIHYDYSAALNRIAVTSVHSDNIHYVEMLSVTGQLLSKHKIQYPDEISEFRFIYPNFSPLKELIFSTGRQLFTLSEDGQISKISLPLDEPVGSPVMHPEGKRLLVIKGYFDSDIVSLSLDGINVQETGQLPQEVLNRSTRSDDLALFQPEGNLIAFQSDRSGDDQVWLADGENLRQLTQFPMDTFLSGMSWAKDGQSLLVNARLKLVQVKLDGSSVNFELTRGIERLFHWDSETMTALVMARVQGVLKLAEVDLTDQKVRVISENWVNWASKTQDGKLIYTDQLDRFWIADAIEHQLIEKLVDQGSNKRFVINNNKVYGINEAHQLWEYSLDTEIFKVHGKVANHINYISDVDDANVLMALQIIGKKGVAELYVE
ncbi:winged helix-turn-helix domain-containing protein (plasmid) [Pseudoalteromonas sp. T1lg65]|uniref:winged helix-turn-helix domain-containing protein n=1 Tax=Pseudoalteromonas sp. T1lg65 TaxID=2077101 RepID=UPI003F7AE691